ncbi:DUF2520 domain-containing protein [Inhella gelatinilytica]|uniref:DUF2520 domain-containing protein n=1 Tax=Inhella gelatinilytica TaxID=2795030 RepID=A0A931NE09_9BURK|nr:DUF2520 domain-containing protein [Inhella gelatinilytica]MBH9552785.1 DUF2520 domain-containing protein [Inhella gelatinilytica]
MHATIALVGAGRTAAHLGQALQAAGWPLVALGVRDALRAAPLAQALGLAPLTPAEACARADWVFLAVRDADIAPVCAALPWRAGQVAVHLSGATPLGALEPAVAAGARAAGFHPLQLMADPLPSREAAAQVFRGVVVGIEAEALDAAPLHHLARDLGALPLALQSEQRALYHAAANSGASGLLAPLSLAQALMAQALQTDEATAWAALAPLARGALDAALARGVGGALSGPLARGDAAVLHRHVQALQTQATADQQQLYEALMRALLPLAAKRLPPEAVQALEDSLRA